MDRVDFHLSLTLEKDVYRRGEPIPVFLRFENAGGQPIQLDGILPLRSEANPPYLEIEAGGGRLIRIEHGIPRELMSQEPIVIRPARSVLLIQVDLLDAPAWIRTREGAEKGDYGRNVDRLAPDLIPGEYSISGHFQPTPRQYRSGTEWIPFTIR